MSSFSPILWACDVDFSVTVGCWSADGFEDVFESRVFGLIDLTNSASTYDEGTKHRIQYSGMWSCRMRVYLMLVDRKVRRSANGSITGLA